MSSHATKTWKYRHHRGTGQAVVTLDGKVHYLGERGTEQSPAKYGQRTPSDLVGMWRTLNA